MSKPRLQCASRGSSYKILFGNVSFAPLEAFVYQIGKIVESKNFDITKQTFDKINGFTISGGEPLDQYDGLVCLLGYLNQISDDIIVFSGYTYNEIINKFPDNGECLFRNIAVLVDGPFIEEQKDIRLTFRGSANQRVLDLKETRRTGSIVKYID